MSPAPGVTRKHSATVVSKAKVRACSPEARGENIPKKREGISSRKMFRTHQCPLITVS